MPKKAEKSEEKPVAGQTIHFTEANGFHSVALVTRVNKDGSLNLFVMRADDVTDNRSVRDVKQSEGAEPGYWHWIEE